MKFNTTYTPNTSLKETVILTDKIKKQLIAYFESKVSLTSIMTPLYYLEENPFILHIEEVTRNVSFDTGKEYKVGYLSLTDSFYLREMLRKLELNPKEGLISESTSIWRDFDESPVMTPEKHEITIQFFANDNDGEEVKAVAKQLYDFVFSICESLKETHKIKNIYPHDIPVISAQSLENEYPDKDPKSREIEFVLEYDAFLLKNPGARLLTGHTHTVLPPTIYDLDDFYQIVLKDRINSSVLKVISVGKIALGKKLSEQLTSFGLNDLKQNKEYSSLLQDDRNIIEIKINMPRLMMALLGKGHISEVQPGVYSDEIKSIKSRYKVQTY